MITSKNYARFAIVKLNLIVFWSKVGEDKNSSNNTKTYWHTDIAFPKYSMQDVLFCRLKAYKIKC